MTLTRAKPGGWQIGERFTHDEANHIDAQLPKAIDGNAGGSYAPSSPILVGGAGIRVPSPSHGDQVTPKAYVDNEVQALDAAKVTAGSAKYAIDAGSSDPLSLTEVFADSGYSLSGGNTVIVPAAGTYNISWTVDRRTASTDNPSELAVAIQVGGAAVGSAFATRFSATTTHSVGVSGSTVARIDTPASQGITVHLSGGGTVQGTSVRNRLSIARVSA